jgi:hypothetical protein
VLATAGERDDVVDVHGLDVDELAADAAPAGAEEPDAERVDVLDERAALPGTARGLPVAVRCPIGLGVGSFPRGGMTARVGVRDRVTLVAVDGEP